MTGLNRRTALTPLPPPRGHPAPIEMGEGGTHAGSWALWHAATEALLTRRRLVELAAIGAVAAPILSACASVAADERFLIEMTGGNRFEPSGLTVPLGATVVWQNAGMTRHTATCDPTLTEELTLTALPPGAAPWNSGDLYTGQTWQRTFTTPGIYLYSCRYHERDGMVATLTVVQQDAAASGGL